MFGEEITARNGKALQLRPKGANAQSLRWTYDEDGARTRTLSIRKQEDERVPA